MHSKEKEKRKLGFLDYLLGFLLILVGVLVFFLAWVAIAERAKLQEIYWASVLNADAQPNVNQMAEHERVISGGKTEGGTEPKRASPFNEWWERLIPALLLALVLLLLVIPAVWIYHFHSLWREGPGIGREDYLAWVTAIGVPYFILGFAMLVEFHAFIEDRRIGVGAIAAIMILYALSVLASFLYIEVRELKKSFAHNVAAASQWFSLSLTLAEADAGQRSPAASITDLLTAWSDIYAVGKEKQRTPRRSLRRNAIGTLLSTYVREESNDFRGALSADKVPESVWPWPTSALNVENPPGGISFIASNTGYYANFLQEAVQHLPSAIKEHSGVFLATITYAPPPLWWNWPSPDKAGFIYSPIEEYRGALVGMAEGQSISSRATIFRKVVLAASGWQTDKLLGQGEWEKMEGWQFLRMLETGDIMRSNQRALPPEYRLHCIDEVKWTNYEVTIGKRHAYWVVDSSAGPLPAYKDFELVKIKDHFAATMHPQGRGVTEIHAVPEPVFCEPLMEGNLSGLNRCSEMLFLGLSGRSTTGPIWEEVDPDLALAMLTTMSPSSETMFITVVWGEERLQELWGAVRRASSRFPQALTTLKGP